MQLTSSVAAVSSIRWWSVFAPRCGVSLRSSFRQSFGNGRRSIRRIAVRLDRGSEKHGYGAVRSAVTDAAGHYQFFSLPVGQYEIRSGKAGFTEEVRTGVHLGVGQSATVDMELRGGRIAAAGHGERRCAPGGGDDGGHSGPGW